MFPAFGLSMLLALALCVHVVRTGQPIYWLLIILILQPLGAVVYLIAIVLPSLSGGASAQRFGASARRALDPGREYREASAAMALAATVQNQMRLAKAAADLGRWSESEALFARAAQGVHADDPVLLLGRAVALIELNRYAEALTVLQTLGQDAEAGRAPPAMLALGRAYEGLGRMTDAEAALQWAAGHVPGLEGFGRYAAFLARTGRKTEAREAVAEMDRRIAQANPQFRREGRAWRDLAARALSGG